MEFLRQRSWACKYTPASGDLLTNFYIPLLRCARRYDRTTGFYSAQTLAAVAQGVERLVANKGKMRLICGCSLEQDEIRAIMDGEELRETVEKHLLANPFEAENREVKDGLELLAWMVANDYLKVKIALPADGDKKLPLANDGIFHEKGGIVEDARGDRLCFNGSLNETLAGWTSRNWDTFHVYRSWLDDAAHLEADETSFHRLWNNQEPTALVLSLPEAVKQRLLKFLPKNTRKLPARLAPLMPEEPEKDSVWRHIHESPKEPGKGDWTGSATCGLSPWPHQSRAFARMWKNWPPRLLIADEVGLGKTIQAGMLLRQGWLAGKIKRALIMAPRALLTQWQNELREKFNLEFPVYDGKYLHWPEGPLARPRELCENWTDQPFLLISSQLCRRRERAGEMLSAKPWDLLIVDEAHHARRKNFNPKNRLTSPPNLLLGLLRKLAPLQKGLLLLTATPMQIDPLEVWDLLSLLGLPEKWTAEEFLAFYRLTSMPLGSETALNLASGLFRACENHFSPITQEEALNLAPEGNAFSINKVIKALRHESDIPRRQLDESEKNLALRLMRRFTPSRFLVSRHTRRLLKAYRDRGMLDCSIAERKVEDIFLKLSPGERNLYGAVEDYIATTYMNAPDRERGAVGFVMTIYRRRLASSFYALAQTMKNRLAILAGKNPLPEYGEDDILEEEDREYIDEETDEEILNDNQAQDRKKRALFLEEAKDIRELLAAVEKLPLDSKARVLLGQLRELKNRGYRQIIIFSQYTDTLDFLRDLLIKDYGVLCFSGRGGEQWDSGQWRPVSRETTREIFKNGGAEIMLCTDAAAEGLNFQFCGALINYDMPWNPMKVEQRIGRIDRLGQEYPVIEARNLLCEKTVESDIYIALSRRIKLFGDYIGNMQPILAKVPGVIRNIALTGKSDRQNKLNAFASQIDEKEASGFDLEEINSSLAPLNACDPAYDLEFLNNVLTNPALMPDNIKVGVLSGKNEYEYKAPGMSKPIRVTTSATYFQEHPESVELWSPGSPAFPWEETRPDK